MAEQKRAYFRFYGALNDFLAPSDRQCDVRYSFWGRPAVKDAIEAQGVPHPEVDRILLNGTEVDFSTQLSSGDRLSVYPWIQHLGGPGDGLRPPLPSPLQFVCDVHLHRLARYLRMLGMDAAFDASWTDARLAKIAAEAPRILLTRDVELLKRDCVRLGFFVRSQDPEDQLREVVERCQVDLDGVTPFQRCLDCNCPLRPAPASLVDEQVPPHARRMNDEFSFCPDCRSVFWKGSHVDRMRRLMRRVFSSVR